MKSPPASFYVGYDGLRAEARGPKLPDRPLEASPPDPRRARSAPRIVVPLALAVAVLLAAVVAPPATAIDAVALPPVVEADDRWGFNAIYPEARWQRLARDAGASWNRWQFRWDDVEPTRGANRFQDHDALVNMSLSNGLAVQGILISVPEWARDRQGPMPAGLYRQWNDPQNLWGQYVMRTVRRYQGRVTHWEIWNEPDFAEVFWAGSVADYYQLLKVGYLAVKSVDPQAKVLMAGLAYWSNQGFLDEMLRLMVTDPIARENNYFFDVLVWHTYSGPTGVLDRVRESRQKLAATVGPKPIWLNETNVPPWEESRLNNFRPFPFSSTIQEQASYMIQTFAYAVALGVEKIFVYRLRDDFREDQAWGLVRDNGTLRPSYVAYQVAARYFSHASSGTIGRQGNAEVVTLRKAGQVVTVLWNRSGGRLVAPFGARATSATLVDQLGVARAIRVGAGQYQLDLPPATADNDLNPAEFMIGGQPLILVESIPDPLLTVEEANPLVAYSGRWDSFSSAGPSENAARRSFAVASGAVVEFEGAAVTWMTSRGPDHGIARVEVDGELQAEIDLYSPFAVWEVPLTFGDFAPGAHRLIVTATGRRIGPATGPYVYVDGFAAGAMRPPASPAPAPPTRPLPEVVPLPPGARPQAAAHGAATTPARRLWAPIVTRARDGWTTTIAVENSGEREAGIVVRFLDERGDEVTRQTLGLGTVGSALVDPRQVPALPDGFGGTALIEATEPVVASVNQVRDDVDALAYTTAGTGAGRAFVPLLFKDFNGWNTGLHVQNLSDAPATVNVTYRPANQPGGPWIETRAVLPRAMAIFYQPDNPALPAGFVGSAVVEASAGAQITVVVNELNAGGSGSSYEGFGSGASTISAPLLFKNAAGWNTGLQVQNVGGAATEVTVTYRATDGRGPWVERGFVPPGGSVTFYQPANPQLPGGFVGSAVVTSSNGQPLVGIVNEVHAERGVAMTYQSFSDGAAMVTAPFAAREWEGWTTGVQVQNLGREETTLTFMAQDPDGTLIALETARVGPGASRTFYLPTVEGIPEGWRGSITVAASPEVPIAAIVNQTRY